MNEVVPTTNAFEKALIEGNLASLSQQERLSYYKKVCESLGLNPLTKPFDYINLNNKLVLYATKSCTEQLRNIHSISLQISSREKFDDVYVVTARAKTKDGREDESTGAVSVAGLRGEGMANAFMKAETKAKRRVTLSICGLAMLDELEVDSIPHTKFQEIEKKTDDGEEESLQAIRDKIKGKKLDTMSTEFLIEILDDIDIHSEKHSPSPALEAFAEKARKRIDQFEPIEIEKGFAHPPVSEEFPPPKDSDDDQGPTSFDPDELEKELQSDAQAQEVRAIAKEIPKEPEKFVRKNATPDETQQLLKVVKDKNIAHRNFMTFLKTNEASLHDLPLEVMRKAYVWINDQSRL